MPFREEKYIINYEKMAQEYLWYIEPYREPRKDEYDGNQVVSWDDCGWIPEELKSAK